MKVNLYSPKAKSASTFTLPKGFEEKVNESLLAQALHVYRNRAHIGTSKTQTRAEVSLTKAKWYRQKGTGRARHGAKSAPIFVGGGVAHGPDGRNRILEMPIKMRQKALASALSLKAKEGKVVATKDLNALKKTKDAQNLVDTVVTGEKAKNSQKITFAVADKNREIKTVMKNIKNAKVVRFSDLNAYKVYLGGILVVDTDAFEKVKETKKNEN